MHLNAIIKNGSIAIVGESAELLRSLEDGNYIISLRPTLPKTIKEWREMYFAQVDEAVSHSGMSRYEIHELYKEGQKIDTTKDFSTDDWALFVENFKWWGIHNLNMYI